MEQNQTRNVMEIDLKEILNVIVKNIVLIVLVGAICGLAANLFSSNFISKNYQSSTKIYVITRQDNTTLTYNDLETGRQLTKDYIELVTARPVLDEVINELKLNMVPEQLKGMISVNVPSDTRILQITVTSNDPYEAKKIADAVRKSSSKHITKVMDIKTVNVVEDANLPTYPSGPNIKQNTIFAAGLGAFLSICVVMVMFLLDDTIKTSNDVEKYLGLGVLGSIPKDSSKGDNDGKIKIRKFRK
ncbi:YveK family protein [Intestinibacter sp.]